MKSVTLNTTTPEQRDEREFIRHALDSAMVGLMNYPIVVAHLGQARSLLKDTGDWSLNYYKTTQSQAKACVLRAFNLKD